MTSRILAALLTLTFGLLLGALLPLGFAMSGQYAHDYREGTLGLANSLAASAEEVLVDHEESTMLSDALTEMRDWDDGHEKLQVAAVDRHGRVVDGDGAGLFTPERAAPGLAGQSSVTQDDGRLIAVVPVRGHDEDHDGDKVAGAVLLSRPLDPLNDRITRLWTGLAGVTVIAVGLAAVLAVALARWVGRPLHRLETTAEALGAGDLDARAVPPVRPPEIRRLTQRFNVMAARLQAVIHENRTMLADVSHQLRTPLAALRLRLELLADDPDPAEFDGALDELGRLGRLVDGLLAMARAEDTTVEPEAVPVADLLDDRAEAWRPVAAERGIRLDVDALPGLTALAVPDQLEQAIDNLVDNALGVMAADGHLRLAARQMGTRVHVVVADDGPGMSDGMKERAFRRFRGDRTNGTGLGLAIVHRIVTAADGDVTLSDTPGGGLTVTLDLPRAL